MRLVRRRMESMRGLARIGWLLRRSMLTCRIHPVNFPTVLRRCLLKYRGEAYEVEDFASPNKVVQRAHDFLDARVPVPPVEIQEIEIGHTLLLERRFHKSVQ